MQKVVSEHAEITRITKLAKTFTADYIKIFEEKFDSDNLPIKKLIIIFHLFIVSVSKLSHSERGMDSTTVTRKNVYYPTLPLWKITFPLVHFNSVI